MKITLDELRQKALNKVAEAIKEQATEVKILLSKGFTNNTASVKDCCEKLEIKQITELLRERFSEYQIKSSVASEGHLTGVLTFSSGPCTLVYPLVWTITISKK